MRSKVYLIGFLFVVVLQANSQIKIENRHFCYETAMDGRNLHFTDKSSGKEYLYSDTVSYCAYIIQDNKRYDADNASRENNLLNLRFGDSEVTAKLQLEFGEDYVTFKVKEVTGKPESLTFLNIPLNLEGLPDEPFAACALSMNLQTHVKQLPALQTHLWATAYQRFGITGSKVNLLGVPQKEILPVIRTVMKQAEELPFSDQGGAWASLGKEGYGSYLMNFGTLTEQTVNEWIGMCKNLGFNQIDSHGGGDFFTFGDFVLNKDKWPDGWDNFKRINQKLHKAGISSIFHTYAFFIDKNSGYVTPKPHPDLAYYDSYTLSSSVKAEDDVIPILESTLSISAMKEFQDKKCLILRIGEELVSFSGITTLPPYKFTGCARGVLGTTPVDHKQGEEIYYLKEDVDRFVPGPETDLFKEIAKKTAQVVDEVDFDGIYFDALDGRIFEGTETSDYYISKFVLEVAKNLKKPVGMEMCDMAHHLWHYRSRWEAWDRPRRGYKKFIDLHLASIINGEYDADFWHKDISSINRYARREKGRTLLPLHLGWWGNQTWSPPQIEPTFPDDIEYLCCKMIGHNAGLSMLGEADKKTLNEKPLFKRLNSIIKQYEELRHRNYFDDSVRTLLREPDKEFTLVKEGRGKWNFKPVNYLTSIILIRFGTATQHRNVPLKTGELFAKTPHIPTSAVQQFVFT